MASVCYEIYASLAWRHSIPPFSQTRRTQVRDSKLQTQEVRTCSYVYPRFTVHRALSDVEAMAELFTETALGELLASLPSRGARQQLKLWRTQKDQRERISGLLHSLGKGVTAAQAKRLYTLGLSRQALVDIRVSTATSEEFQHVLFEKGVRSRPLREKLTGIITR